MDEEGQVMSMPKVFVDDNELIEELQSQLARMRTLVSSFERSSNYWYDKLRLLENAVRNTNEYCEGERARSVALGVLSRRVPQHPRPTLTERRKELYKRLKNRR